MTNPLKKRAAKHNAGAFLSLLCLLSAMLAVLVSCSGSYTEEQVPPRAALLHGEGQAGAIECIDAPKDSLPELYAPQAFLYDVAAGKYIILKGNENILYPASTTKLLTALYALTLLSPDELITPGKEQELKDPQSAIAFVKENHTLTAEMLIEGMLLPSGGDAAYALAAAGGYRLGDDDISAAEAVRLFVSGMNGYAEELGMCGSSFKNPDGFFDEEHYSTLEDMTLLAIAASENDIIMKYASLSSASVRYASGHTNTWYNTNRMLHEDSEYYSPYVTGLKTGTLEGNSCLIATFDINGKSYICGVFSESDEEHRYIDMQRVIAYCEGK